MSRRRILFITNLAPHYCRPLFETLAARHDIEFDFFSQGNEPYLSGRLQYGADVPVLRLRTLVLAGQPWQPGLSRVINPQRYDVVVKCLNGRLMVPWTAALASVRGVPLVLWTGMWHHPATWSHRLTHRLTRSVYGRAGAIVTYGDHVKRFLVEEEGVPEEDVFVAGQAVPEAPFLAVSRRAKHPDPVFAFVGQLEFRKGISDLLEAFAALEDPNARLIFAGSGSLRDTVDQAAAADPRIEPRGYVDQTGLPSLLAEATGLVVPSVSTARSKEPWGLVANEAMLTGAPVIATDAVGAAAGGLVIDGRNGYVVPEGDPQALANAMRRLAADPVVAAQMGVTARADAQAFSYSRMVEAFEAAIDHALDHTM